MTSWDLFGCYFGFSECCVDSFSTLKHVGGPPRKLTGTGYIPCLKCNEKSEAELVETINSNRLARLEFPQEESHEVIMEHIAEVFSIDWNEWE